MAVPEQKEVRQVVVTDFIPANISNTAVVDCGEKQNRLWEGTRLMGFLKVVSSVAVLRHTMPDCTGTLN